MPVLDRSASATAIVQRLPDELYRSLPNADLTSVNCASILARALDARNPRLIRSWLDHERESSEVADLMSCLAIAIDVQLHGVDDADVRCLAEEVHAEARAHLGRPEPTESSEQVGNICDGILVALRFADARLHDHSKSVEYLAARLARAAGVSEIVAERARLAARIHEIGRLRVVGFSGLQDGFTHDMRVEFRRRLGDIALGVDDLVLQPIADVVTDVYTAPLANASDESQIVRIADAMVSMCEARPYRKAFTATKALDQLRKDAESRFNPHFVETLAGLLGYARRYAASA